MEIESDKTILQLSDVKIHLQVKIALWPNYYYFYF